MTKRERVLAAINLQELCETPSQFSFHFPAEEMAGEPCIKAHLKYFEESDTDIVKIMNENLLTVDYDIRTVSDYAAIGKYSINDKLMQDQLDLTKRILEGVKGDEFTCGTLHGITASGIHPIETRGVPYETTREMLCAFLREDGERTFAQMQRIGDVLCELAEGYVKTGVDAVYYASLGGEAEYFTDEEFEKYIKPIDIRVLQAIKAAGGYSILHICKGPLKMERYKGYEKYSDIINWGVYETGMSLNEGREFFGADKCLMGGLKNRGGILELGTKEEIEAEVRRVIDSFGRRGFILGADCTVSTQQDVNRLRWAVEAARK